MTGFDLRNGRKQHGWTQEETAEHFGVTQAYLSMMENGRRAVPDDLATKFARVFEVSPLTLPLREAPTAKDFALELGALGYPGFAYVNRAARVNPASFLFMALDQADLDSRVVEGLPWMVFAYPDLQWSWVLPRVKVRDRQNRLGFVVSLGVSLAERENHPFRSDKLKPVLNLLERSKLVSEDTLCKDSMTKAERDWLRQNRTQQAREWNLLTDLQVDQIRANI